MVGSVFEAAELLVETVGQEVFHILQEGRQLE